MQSYDMKPHSTKIFRDIINALGAFIQSQFMNQPGGPAAQTGDREIIHPINCPVDTDIVIVI